MTSSVLPADDVPLPEAAASVGDGLAWLDEVLACPRCRGLQPGQRREERRCPHLEANFSIRNGIVYPADQDESLLLSEQRKVWEILDKARGTYALPVDKVLLLPEEPQTRALLDWLRALLRGRSPLRILELGARRGWAARALAEDGHRVVAGDVLDDVHIGLGCAVRLREHTRRWFGCVRTSAVALPFHAEAFDCVFCFDTLRQTQDLERAFQEVSRVLRPGGLFLALQEPFRGALTTQTQRLLDSTLYRLARWWLPGKMSRTLDPDVAYLRSRLGATLHEARRRVPFCLARAEAAGLRTTILPTAVALSVSPDLKPAATLTPSTPPDWLHSLASAYGLNSDRLRALVDVAGRTLGYDLIPELLAHWILVGNIEGVLLARKGGDRLQPFPAQPPMNPERSRRLDGLLLACAPDGFLPLYGVHAVYADEQERYFWIQPHAGLIVPASSSLEVTMGGPSKSFCKGPVRIEFRIETERFPVAAVLVRPGKIVTLKIPIPASALRHASLFVGITANRAFLPSDFNPGPGCDTRLLAVQLHSIRPGQMAANDPSTVLHQVTQSLAQSEPISA